MGKNNGNWIVYAVLAMILGAAGMYGLIKYDIFGNNVNLSEIFTEKFGSEIMLESGLACVEGGGNWYDQADKVACERYEDDFDCQNLFLVDADTHCIALGAIYTCDEPGGVVGCYR